MYCPSTRPRPQQSSADLHEASRISSSDITRSTLGDVAKLGRQHRIRSLRLDEIEDSSTAATLLRIAQRYELELRNRGENCERRKRHALTMKQVTRRIVTNAKW